MKKNLLTYETFIDYKLSPVNLNNPLLQSSTAIMCFRRVLWLFQNSILVMENFKYCSAVLIYSSLDEFFHLNFILTLSIKFTYLSC